MSYLSQPTSKTEYGVVQVGNFINVNDDGIISSPEVIAGPGITVDYTTDYITVSATGADLIHTYGTTTSYAATLEDEYIGVYSASSVTITLPPGTDGRVYYIKDEYGKDAGRIKIQPAAGELIDNKPNYTIGIPFQCVNIVFRAGSWRLI